MEHTESMFYQGELIPHGPRSPDDCPKGMVMVGTGFTATCKKKGNQDFTPSQIETATDVIFRSLGVQPSTLKRINLKDKSNPNLYFRDSTDVFQVTPSGMVTVNPDMGEYKVEVVKKVYYASSRFSDFGLTALSLSNNDIQEMIQKVTGVGIEVRDRLKEYVQKAKKQLDIRDGESFADWWERQFGESVEETVKDKKFITGLIVGILVWKFLK